MPGSFCHYLILLLLVMYGLYRCNPEPCWHLADYFQNSDSEISFLAEKDEYRHLWVSPARFFLVEKGKEKN